MSEFLLKTEGDQFVRDGKPHRILSGALHYFRVVPEYWEDRLRKYKACGLNTVETYVPWNLHEPQPGVYDFDGLLDIRKFIETASKLDMDVIVRPGPYICAEWEFGGFPAWLLKDRNVRLRCMDQTYLAHVDRYFGRLMQEFVDLQSTRGGRVVAVQVENEYGSYGIDKEYLSWSEDCIKRHGIDVLLFTSDGPEDHMLQGGTLPHLLKTANFGSKATEAFKKLREYQPEGPLMCMEFWNGWFDHWGLDHNTRDAEDAAEALDEILANDASVNVYMMHGGTNFGFWNGANKFETYTPTVTSYDYDAPLDEQGNPTPKFEKFREVFAKYGAEVGPIPEKTTGVAFGRVEMQASAAFLGQVDLLADPVQSACPLSMEDIDQNFGFILYETEVSGPRPESKIMLQKVRDRAWVYLDGKFLGLVVRNQAQEGIAVSIPAGGAKLQVLVENEGRINYGPDMYDRKGITHGIRMGLQFLHNWKNYPLSMEDRSRLEWGAVLARGNPRLYRTEIQIDEPADTFLRVIEGHHGIVWLNGFALGRYRAVGPQQTLYVPAPLLKSGSNTIEIFELEPDAVPSVEFMAEAVLGGLPVDHACPPLDPLLA
ncbi:MAG TPA: beta-galactosidase [Opitutae bacterium]|nr:beta-galactosidase [Puniceicoccaceae bacterium]HBR94227.1 beta-galactosidase [Opitutae bacterium]